MQKLGDCSAIQFVQSMQVGGYKGDARGYKWVQLDAKLEACRWRRRRCSGSQTMVVNSALAVTPPVLPSIVGKKWKIRNRPEDVDGDNI